MAARNVSTAAYAPVLAGVTLPAPNGYSQTWEDVRTTLTLASGVERHYVKGRRLSYSLSWSRMRATDLDLLRQAVSGFGSTTLVTFDGETVVVDVASLPDETPVAGTNPVRYAVSVELREPGIRSPFSGPVTADVYGGY